MIDITAITHIECECGCALFVLKMDQALCLMCGKRTAWNSADKWQAERKHLRALMRRVQESDEWDVYLGPLSQDIADVLKEDE